MLQGDSGSKAYSLRRIKLELARSREQIEHPGSHAYEFVAPLDANHHLSTEGWHAERNLCFVHRLEHGAIIERGLLVHKAGGDGGGTWAFDYADDADSEDRGIHFATRIFTVGEYISLREADDVVRTYRIESVSSL